MSLTDHDERLPCARCETPVTIEYGTAIQLDHDDSPGRSVITLCEECYFEIVTPVCDVCGDAASLDEYSSSWRVALVGAEIDNRDALPKVTVCATCRGVFRRAPAPAPGSRGVSAGPESAHRDDRDPWGGRL